MHPIEREREHECIGIYKVLADLFEFPPTQYDIAVYYDQKIKLQLESMG